MAIKKHQACKTKHYENLLPTNLTEFKAYYRQWDAKKTLLLNDINENLKVSQLTAKQQRCEQQKKTSVHSLMKEQYNGAVL